MKTPNDWYSAKPETDVYHNNTLCTEGNNIETFNVREGQGGKRLCRHCTMLNRMSVAGGLGLMGDFWLASGLLGSQKLQ